MHLEVFSYGNMTPSMSFALYLYVLLLSWLRNDKDDTTHILHDNHDVV